MSDRTYLALVISALALWTGYAENLPSGAAPPIQDYVTAHYRELQGDLQKGDGVSLTSLLNMLHIPAEEKDLTIKRIRSLSEAYPALADFAERVPDLAHKDRTPPASTASTVTKPDLESLFEHMKYRTRLHLTMVNGDQIDGTFSSFDRPRGIVWVKSDNAAGVFGRKACALQNVKDVSVY